MIIIALSFPIGKDPVISIREIYRAFNFKNKKLYSHLLSTSSNLTSIHSPGQSKKTIIMSKR